MPRKHKAHIHDVPTPPTETSTQYDFPWRCDAHEGNGIPCHDNLYVIGHGETPDAAERDAYTQAIVCIQQHLISTDFRGWMSQPYAYLFEIVKLQTYLDEYATGKCGYGHIWPSHLHTRDYVERDAKPPFVFAGPFGASIPAYAYAGTLEEARRLFLQRVAIQLALRLRQESDPRNKTDLMEMSGKLTDLQERALPQAVAADPKIAQAMQNVLHPDLAWKHAPPIPVSEVQIVGA